MSRAHWRRIAARIGHRTDGAAAAALTRAPHCVTHAWLDHELLMAML